MSVLLNPHSSSVGMKRAPVACHHLNQMLRKWILPRRFGLAALALSVFLAPAPSAPLAPAAAPVSSSSPLPTAAEIDSVLHELSSITGFKIRRQLPFALITRDQINHYVKE